MPRANDTQLTEYLSSIALISILFHTIYFETYPFDMEQKSMVCRTSVIFKLLWVQ